MPKLKENAARLTAAQVRAARGLLNMSVTALAEATRLDPKTIWRAEEKDGPVRITSANAERIISVLKDSGVHLIEEDGKGVGVRLTAKAAEAQLSQSKTQ